MYETPEDLTWLQALLDRSRAGASEHLRGIISEKWAVPASTLVQRLTGMRVLSVSTVSAGGRPRISGVDGHFLRAHWVFSTSGTSVKAADLRERPQVSASYLEGDSFGVFTHGDAEFLPPGQPDWARVDEHLTGHYGSSPTTWGPDIVYLRIRPRWMVGYQHQ